MSSSSGQGSPLPTKWTDDWHLILYCEMHSHTERALFHKEDVDRMLTLAGFPDRVCAVEWASMHEDMRELCHRAKERLGEQARLIREEEQRAAEAEERRRREERTLAAMDHLFLRGDGNGP